jgi:hypothetical protein
MSDSSALTRDKAINEGLHTDELKCGCLDQPGPHLQEDDIR